MNGYTLGCLFVVGWSAVFFVGLPVQAWREGVFDARFAAITVLLGLAIIVAAGFGAVMS